MGCRYCAGAVLHRGSRRVRVQFEATARWYDCFLLSCSFSSLRHVFALQQTQQDQAMCSLMQVWTLPPSHTLPNTAHVRLLLCHHL